MHACALLTVSWDQNTARSRIARLHSDPPLMLRPTHPVRPDPMPAWAPHLHAPARVSLVAGAAGPVGGDSLRLGIDVESGAALVLRNVAATLLLPGSHNEPSSMETVVRVASGAVLIWEAGPLIAARNCRHHAVTRVSLEPGARLFLREELLLGRHAEQPGAIRQRLRVCLADRPVYDQEVAIGPGASGWDSPAGVGGRRALGAVLMVDPCWEHQRPTVPTVAKDSDTVLLPLGGPAVLLSALARDGLALRQQLEIGVAEVEAAMDRLGTK
jgi:urease accessory protein